ncbi:MAG: cytidylate kinase-like family protein [Nitrospirae bacterium]|nr:cytidylate kinase-like family protein [Nitrospirota bacterium]
MAILTVSREFGSGGREIAQAAAALLNYESIDKQRIFSDLKTSGNEWGKWGEYLDEHLPTIWEKYDWSFKGFSALIQSRIFNYALKDKIVIIGRGGNFLLKDIPAALRIRIVAPVGMRIERVMMRESVDRDTAQWLIKKTDNERACFIHSIYGKKWDDPTEYDKVFDAGMQKEDEIINIIRTIVREKEASAAGFEILRMRAEAAKIKAGLFINPKFFIPTLDVFYDGKVIVLRGVVHGPGEHKAVEEEAKKLAKDLPVRCELHYRG